MIVNDTGKARRTSIALAVILIAMSYWRKTSGFLRHAYTANVLMMTAGWLLVGYQLTGYFVS